MLESARNAALAVVKAARPLFSARIGGTLPAVAGLVLIPAGVSLIFLPAGLIVAGILCLCVDYRM